MDTLRMDKEVLRKDKGLADVLLGRNEQRSEPKTEEPSTPLLRSIDDSLRTIKSILVFFVVVVCIGILGGLVIGMSHVK